MQRNKLIKDGKTMKTIAIVLYCLIPVYIILFFTGDLELDSSLSPIGASIMMGVSLCIIGTILFIIGDGMLKRADAYSHCAKQLCENNVVDIDAVAKKLNRRYDDVVVDMQGLIRTGYFGNADIDLVNRKLIPIVDTKPTTTFICPHCGGQNKVADTTAAICEFCDSTLF